MTNFSNNKKRIFQEQSHSLARIRASEYINIDTLIIKNTSVTLVSLVNQTADYCFALDSASSIVIVSNDVHKFCNTSAHCTSDTPALSIASKQYPMQALFDQMSIVSDMASLKLFPFTVFKSGKLFKYSCNRLRPHARHQNKKKFVSMPVVLYLCQCSALCVKDAILSRYFKFSVTKNFKCLSFFCQMQKIFYFIQIIVHFFKFKFFTLQL